MKKKIFSLCFNIAIIVLTIIALILAFFDMRMVNMNYAFLFKYFTTLSNLFLFVACIILSVFEIININSKNRTIPNWANVVKMSATTTTTITMFVVLLFLLPISFIINDKTLTPVILFKNSNLIFHIINPVLGIVSFLLFENDKKSIKFSEIFYVLIFIVCYEIFYTLDVYLKFMPDNNHDWYHFTIAGNAIVPLIEIGFIVIATGINWLFLSFNKKIHILEKKSH